MALLGEPAAPAGVLYSIEITLAKIDRRFHGNI